MLNSFLFYSRVENLIRGEKSIMEPDYQNNYQDDLHLDDEAYEIKSDRINLEYLNNPPRRKKRYSETNPKDMPVILIIILANFIAGVMCIIANSDHFDTGGLNYQYIHNNKEYIRLLTYMFLHANIPHFVNNMVALYIFGSRLEPRVGSLRTAIIYFGSGIASGLVSVYVSHLINPDVIRFAAGASGAIFGVMCATLFTNFSSKTDSNKTTVIVSIALIVVYALISNGANVDILGHLGGGIAGGILIFILYHDNLDDAFESTVSTIIAIVLTIIISFVGVSSAGIGTKANPMQDSRIDTVKSQQIFKDYTVTYGECLDNKCTDPEWTIFSSTDDKKVVEFNGNVVYNNLNSSLTIQFVYNDSDDYWALSYMALNGTAMDSNGAALLLNYLCSDYFN